MARIGTFDVTVFRGYMPRARRRYRLKSRGGVNGDGVIFDAWHTGTVAITTRVLIATGQVAALLDNYAKMQEAYVTVVDQFGDVYQDVLVVDAVQFRDLHRPDTRPLGPQHWGPWLVQADPGEAVTFMVVHRCHALWPHYEMLGGFVTEGEKK